MIEKERIEEAKRNVKQYIQEGLLRIKDKDAPKFADFFMKNAESSLQTASILQEISDQQALKNTLKVESDFESYLGSGTVFEYDDRIYSSLLLFFVGGLASAFSSSPRRGSYDSLNRKRSNYVYFLLGSVKSAVGI